MKIKNRKKNDRKRFMAAARPEPMCSACGQPGKHFVASLDLWVCERPRIPAPVEAFTYEQPEYHGWYSEKMHAMNGSVRWRTAGGEVLTLTMVSKKPEHGCGWDDIHYRGVVVEFVSTDKAVYFAPMQSRHHYATRLLAS